MTSSGVGAAQHGAVTREAWEVLRVVEVDAASGNAERCPSIEPHGMHLWIAGVPPFLYRRCIGVPLPPPVSGVPGNGIRPIAELRQTIAEANGGVLGLQGIANGLLDEIIRPAASAAAAVAAPRYLLDPVHPEATCQECGRANIVWFAQNRHWDRAVPGKSGILCPVCFAIAYEDATGGRPVWELVMAPDRRGRAASVAAAPTDDVMPNGHRLRDYREAVDGVGPLAYTWFDEPARLVRDLVAAVEQARAAAGVSGTPDETQGEMQWCMFAGGDDPGDAAWVRFHRDADDAEEEAQWVTEGGVAYRTASYGPWQLYRPQNDDVAAAGSPEGEGK